MLYTSEQGSRKGSEDAAFSEGSSPAKGVLTGIEEADEPNPGQPMEALRGAAKEGFGLDLEALDPSEPESQDTKPE